MSSLNGSSSADQIRLGRREGTDWPSARIGSPQPSTFNITRERFSQWIVGWCYCQLSIQNRCFICLVFLSMQAEGEIYTVDHTSTLRIHRQVAKTRQARSSAVYPTAVAKLYPRNLRRCFLRSFMTHPGTWQPLAALRRVETPLALQSIVVNMSLLPMERLPMTSKELSR